MEAVLWILLPVFTATGSALLACFVMQARLEVAVVREKENRAEAEAALQSHQKLLEEKVRAAEEEARRRSLDDFLEDFRVETRHYMKESRSLFLKQKSMVLQERLFFRNIPLSEWVTRELPVEEDSDLRMLAEACSIFSTKASSLGVNGNKLLR